MTDTKGVLDALRKELQRRLDEARSAQGEARMKDHGLYDNHFYWGAKSALAALQGWLDQEIASASSPDVDAELPAVRSTAWLDALREIRERSVSSAHGHLDKTGEWPPGCHQLETALFEAMRLTESVSNDQDQL